MENDSTERIHTDPDAEPQEERLAASESDSGARDGDPLWAVGTASPVEAPAQDLPAAERLLHDPSALVTLRETVLSELARRATPERPIRIWIPAAAGGDDAYALGLLLSEELSEAPESCRFEIFATDVDSDALERARAGLYPDSIRSELSSEQLERFFVREGDAFRVKAHLREKITFAAQDLLRDAVISEVDLIGCRHLLGKLPAEARMAALTNFHFALNPGGYLFLERSERELEARELFEVRDPYGVIYQRLETAPDEEASAALSAGLDRRNQPSKKLGGKSRLRDRAERALLQHCGAAGVVVDRQFQIHQFLGDTKPYLDFPSGDPDWNLLRIALPELRGQLRRVLLEAIEERVDSISAFAWLEPVDESVKVACIRITMRRMDSEKDAGRLFAVIFEKLVASGGGGLSPNAAEEESSRELMRQFDLELKRKGEELAGIREQLKTSEAMLEASREALGERSGALLRLEEEIENSASALESMSQKLGALELRLRDESEELEGRGAEEGAREAEERYRFLLDTALECAALFLDPGGRILTFSSGAEALFGYSEEEVRGESAALLWAGHEGSRALEDRLEICMRESKLEEEHLYRRKNGDEFWARSRMQAVRKGEGEIIGLAQILHDLTPNRRLEQSLRDRERDLHQLSESFEGQIVNRTADLRERARRMEGLASELTNAGSAERHRLRRLMQESLGQMMTTSILQLGDLRNLVENEEAYDKVNEVETLLRRSIDETRALTLLLSPPGFDHQTLSGSLSSLTSTLERIRRLKVRFRAEGDAPELSAPMRLFLYQAVCELCFNVVEHAGVEEATLTLSPEGDEAIRILLEDEGRGCDPTRLEERLRSNDDFGLGGIVRGLESVGGRAEFESAMGRGFRASLHVPVKVPIEERRPPEAEG